MNRVPRGRGLQEVGIGVQHFPCYVNQTLRPHSANVVLLSYIVSGRARHHMGEHQYDEEGGALGITHYGQEHDILTGPDGIRIYNIYLDLQRHALPELPSAFRDILPEILPLHPALQNRLNRRVRLAFSAPARITALVEAMHREELAQAEGWQEALRSYFRIFLIETCRQAAESGIEAGAAVAQLPAAWLERVRRHIDQHFREPLSLAQLAEIGDVSPAYLCRAFKAQIGKTVIDYLNERRLQAAMMLLRGSDQKVLQIALDCGFNDLAYFNRRFKRLLGQTPSAYRHA